MAVSSSLPEEINYIDFAGVTTTTQQPKLSEFFLNHLFQLRKLNSHNFSFNLFTVPCIRQTDKERRAEIFQTQLNWLDFLDDRKNCK